MTWKDLKSRSYSWNSCFYISILQPETRECETSRLVHSVSCGSWSRFIIPDTAARKEWLPMIGEYFSCQYINCPLHWVHLFWIQPVTAGLRHRRSDYNKQFTLCAVDLPQVKLISRATNSRGRIETKGKTNNYWKGLLESLPALEPITDISERSIFSLNLRRIHTGTRTSLSVALLSPRGGRVGLHSGNAQTWVTNHKHGLNF